MNKIDDKSLKERLELIEAALDHFYDTDTETLIGEYQRFLDKKKQDQDTGSPPTADRDQALAYFGNIPDRCNKNESLEMKPEMLQALTEEEFDNLCRKLVADHPENATEISSMFDFCLKMKRMMAL